MSRQAASSSSLRPAPSPPAPEALWPGLSGSSGGWVITSLARSHSSDELDGLLENRRSVVVQRSHVVAVFQDALLDVPGRDLAGDDLRGRRVHHVVLGGPEVDDR